jgi:two-component system chemotaxis response regulator CheY
MDKKRVLVVDDTSFMRAVLKDVLRKLGITQVFEAANGIDAVQQFKAVLPDLVILDITMPEMDGMEALKAIMAFDETAKVIMISSRSFKSLVIESHQHGAADFIAKPFQTYHLMETICKHLNAVPQP